MNAPRAAYTFREIRRFVCTILASRRFMLLLVAMLLLDWAALPCNTYERSTLGRLFPLAKCLRTTAHGRPMPIILWRDPSGLHAWVMNNKFPPPTMGGSAQALQANLFRDRVTRRGLWALTSEHRSILLWDDYELTPSERAKLPAVILRALEDAEAVGIDHDQPPWVFDLLARGRLHDVRPLIGGYIHNTFAALAAAAIVIGISLRGSNAIAATRRARAESRGLCPRCGFDLRGQREPGCPECGAGRADPIE